MDVAEEIMNFPSFSEGLSLRLMRDVRIWFRHFRFPFLFGGTFIEAPSASSSAACLLLFPFLFGGTFIEAVTVIDWCLEKLKISLPFRRDFH